MILFNGVIPHPLSHDWGNDALELEDYFLLSTTLGSIIGPDFMVGPLIMVDYLQDAIDSGKDRFQVRIHNTGLMTNNNNAMDAWGYRIDLVNLNVSSYMN